jgi:hypothetical protein
VVVLLRPHDREHRLAVVPEVADGLEADRRRHPLAGVVANVQGERHNAAAGVPTAGIEA